jgi:hypothetical protein
LSRPVLSALQKGYAMVALGIILGFVGVVFLLNIFDFGRVD